MIPVSKKAELDLFEKQRERVLVLLEDFNFSNFHNLQFLDTSYNKFTGTISESMFELLPNLHMLSLSFNCLKSVLPTSLCSLSKIQTILIDELGSQCEETKYRFFSKTEYLPKCYWSIPPLQTFHVIGNGLLGQLGAAAATAGSGGAACCRCSGQNCLCLPFLPILISPSLAILAAPTAALR